MADLLALDLARGAELGFLEYRAVHVPIHAVAQLLHHF